MVNFTGLIITLLVIAFILQVDFIFYILYVCVGVYAWSRWYAPRVLKNLRVERAFEDHVFLGEVVDVTVRIKNQNRLPVPWLEISESITPELLMGQRLNQALSLRAGETAECHYQLLASRRGFYRLGPLRLYAGDLFGLIEEQQAIVPAGYITVYPNITPLHKLTLTSRLPFGTVASRQRLFEDPARPMGVREFRSGDSIRQINWKVSAHTRSLVVKTLQPAISLDTAIFLNLHAEDYDRIFRHSTVEWAIELAASLAAHLTSQRQAVGLLTNGIDPLKGQEGNPQFDDDSGRLLRIPESSEPAHPIPPRTGRPHLMKILERLARIEAGPTVPFEQWVAQAAVPLNWGVTVLVVSPRVDESVCRTLHHLVQRGLNPVLLATQKQVNFGEVRERARRLGFVAYEVVQKKDLVTKL